MTENKKQVAVCDTQPLTAVGVRWLIESSSDMRCAEISASLAAATEIARRAAPDIFLIDKAFGIQAVMQWLAELRTVSPSSSAVVWGISITEAEALRLLQIGARGVVRKATEPMTLLACLRAAAEGQSWMEDGVFRDAERIRPNRRTDLTARERQVLELVEQGYKNKDIAGELGIRPGTVKIHLKHIFEKTGVRGRFGLALCGLRERGMLSLTEAVGTAQPPVAEEVAAP